MKLYIKQRIFSLNDKYDIYDSNGNVVFDVESEFFTVGAKVHLYDRNGHELFHIKKKEAFILSNYEIYQKEDLCACVNREFKLLETKLKVESNLGMFDMNGDFMAMNYKILHNGQFFGSIQKKWLSWGSSYELDVSAEENAGFVCALVIAIDDCLHNEENS